MKSQRLFLSMVLSLFCCLSSKADTTAKLVDETKEVNLALLGTENNPIKVGLAGEKSCKVIDPQQGIKMCKSPNAVIAEEIYLGLLRDWVGKPYKYERLGSTGTRVTENREIHILDIYEITSSTGEKRKLLIDMYHPEKHPCDQPAPKDINKVSCQSILSKYKINANSFKDTDKREVPLNVKDYILSLESKLQLGDPAYEYAMGELYFSGNGVKKDRTKGLELNLSSAKKGFKPAMLLIGHVYSNYCMSSLPSLYDEQKCTLAKKYLNAVKNEYMSASDILDKIAKGEKRRENRN